MEGEGNFLGERKLTPSTVIHQVAALQAGRVQVWWGLLRSRCEQKPLSPVIGERVVAVGTC
jgi:hypothetical protein